MIDPFFAWLWGNAGALVTTSNRDAGLTAGRVRKI